MIDRKAEDTREQRTELRPRKGGGSTLPRKAAVFVRTSAVSQEIKETRSEATTLNVD